MIYIKENVDEEKDCSSENFQQPFENRLNKFQKKSNRIEENAIKTNVDYLKSVKKK